MVGQSEFRKSFVENAERRQSRIILALDTEDWSKASRVLEECGKHLAAVKIHPEHPETWGFKHAQAVQKIKEFTNNAPVILDAKLADIDSSNAMKAKHYFNKGYDAIICHAFPGEKAVEAVVKAADSLGKGVFLLTAMTSPGHHFTQDKIAAFSQMAKKLNTAGVIAPGNQYEILSQVKKELGPEPLVLSPGIGFQGGEASKAINAGSDFAIVGRAILDDKEPEKIAVELKKVINEALEALKSAGG